MSAASRKPFSVGVGGDFRQPDGTLTMGDMGLDGLDAAGIPWEFMPPSVNRALTAEHLSSHPAILMGAPDVRADAILAADPKPILLARFGIGVDMIDVDACTANDILISITPDGTMRPMAVAALTHILASTNNMYARDLMIREQAWGRDRRRWMGMGIRGKTVGVIGLGRIGSLLVKMLGPLEPKVIAYDPYVKPEHAAGLGVELVGKDELLRSSDVVVVVAPLTPETHHLMSTREFGLMKPSAYFVNVGRGAIVDHAALVAALKDGEIRGAGMDVFESEPLAKDDPIIYMPNVILTPHSLCMSDEWALESGKSAVRACISVSKGEVPPFVGNPAVLERPSFQARLRAMRDA